MHGTSFHWRVPMISSDRIKAQELPSGRQPENRMVRVYSPTFVGDYSVVRLFFFHWLFPKQCKTFFGFFCNNLILKRKNCICNVHRGKIIPTIICCNKNYQSCFLEGISIWEVLELSHKKGSSASLRRLSGRQAGGMGKAGGFKQPKRKKSTWILENVLQLKQILCSYCWFLSW